MSQPHQIAVPTGEVKTFRCSCGDRFRLAWRARMHSDVANVLWRHGTGEDERAATRELLAPWEEESQ